MVRLGEPMFDAVIVACSVKELPAPQAVGFMRFFGSSANWMPLSVRTVWILWGTALRRTSRKSQAVCVLAIMFLDVCRNAWRS